MSGIQRRHQKIAERRLHDENQWGLLNKQWNVLEKKGLQERILTRRAFRNAVGGVLAVNVTHHFISRVQIVRNAKRKANIGKQPRTLGTLCKRILNDTVIDCSERPLVSMSPNTIEQQVLIENQSPLSMESTSIKNGTAEQIKDTQIMFVGIEQTPNTEVDGSELVFDVNPVVPLTGVVATSTMTNIKNQFETKENDADGCLQTKVPEYTHIQDSSTADADFNLYKAVFGRANEITLNAVKDSRIQCYTNSKRNLQSQYRHCDISTSNYTRPSVTNLSLPGCSSSSLVSARRHQLESVEKKRTCLRTETVTLKDVNDAKSRLPTNEDDFYLDKSTIAGAGTGLFAARNFDAGEFVVKYDGEKLKVGEALLREAKYNLSGVGIYMMQFQSSTPNGFWIDATQDLTLLGRYINHAIGPKENTIKRFTSDNQKEVVIYFQAKKDIKTGEELFYNYGDPASVKQFFTKPKANTPLPLPLPGLRQITKKLKITKLDGCCQFDIQGSSITQNSAFGAFSFWKYKDESLHYAVRLKMAKYARNYFADFNKINSLYHSPQEYCQHVKDTSKPAEDIDFFLFSRMETVSVVMFQNRKNSKHFNVSVFGDHKDIIYLLAERVGLNTTYQQLTCRDDDRFNFNFSPAERVVEGEFVVAEPGV